LPNILNEDDLPGKPGRFFGGARGLYGLKEGERGDKICYNEQTNAFSIQKYDYEVTAKDTLPSKEGH